MSHARRAAPSYCCHMLGSDRLFQACVVRCFKEPGLICYTTLRNNRAILQRARRGTGGMPASSESVPGAPLMKLLDGGTWLAPPSVESLLCLNSDSRVCWMVVVSGSSQSLSLAKRRAVPHMATIRRGRPCLIFPESRCELDGSDRLHRFCPYPFQLTGSLYQMDRGAFRDSCSPLEQTEASGFRCFKFNF